MRFKILYLSIFCSGITGCSMLPMVPAPVSAPEPTVETPREVPPSKQTETSLRRAEALLQVLLALGIDYRYGGQSPTTGFDCSGLVAHVFREAYGLRLPRTSHAQATTGSTVVPTELEAGDLVFFNTLNRPFSHVGIYLGDGRFVHAPRTGARVRVERFDGAYWIKRFDGARRIAL